jgi:hypothetical protein
MIPRLGDNYDIDIEVTSKPRAEYNTEEYFALDLPMAPAVMVGEEIITEGRDIDDHTVEVAICRHMGLPEPGKKGIMGRLFRV